MFLLSHLFKSLKYLIIFFNIYDRLQKINIKKAPAGKPAGAFLMCASIQKESPQVIANAPWKMLALNHRSDHHCFPVRLKRG